MNEPKRKPGRPRKVPLIVATVAEEPVYQGPGETPPPPSFSVPDDWTLGALLNVRNNGAEYVLTLFPEEYDNRKPERALKFTNYGECQNFVSAWYARTWHDPRA